MSFFFLARSAKNHVDYGQALLRRCYLSAAIGEDGAERELEGKSCLKSSVHNAAEFCQH